MFSNLHILAHALEETLTGSSWRIHQVKDSSWQLTIDIIPQISWWSNSTYKYSRKSPYAIKLMYLNKIRKWNKLWKYHCSFVARGAGSNVFKTLWFRIDTLGRFETPIPPTISFSKSSLQLHIQILHLNSYKVQNPYLMHVILLVESYSYKYQFSIYIHGHPLCKSCHSDVWHAIFHTIPL